MMNHGEFPRPVRIGRRAVGWRSSDVEEWLKALNEVSSD
jgi:prophage regulatory protein